jgi:ketosteroid isomerase-like protein
LRAPDLELVARSWTAWAERDMDSITATWDPEIEWDLTRYEEAPPGTVARGIDEVMGMMVAWLATWRSYEVMPESFEQAGEGEVLVMVRRRARTRGTDSPADRLAAQLWTLRDGRVLRIRSFSDVAEARRVAGLD